MFLLIFQFPKISLDFSLLSHVFKNYTHYYPLITQYKCNNLCTDYLTEPIVIQNKNVSNIIL